MSNAGPSNADAHSSETSAEARSAGARVHVGPADRLDPRLLDAVRDGGGRVVDAADADAVVWLGSDPDELAATLHDGVDWVQLHSAGVDEWIAAGVVTDDRIVTSAAGAFADAVAEHTVGLLITGFRRLHRYACAEGWRPRDDMRQLRRATVAIVGAGGIGRAVIAALEPFAVRVIAVNRSGRPVPGADEVVTQDRVGELWPRADAVVLSAPATADTIGMIDRAALAAMPTHAVVVNVGRGPLIDTDALVGALADGQIGFAGLDVTDPEPLPDDHPLWCEPRCLVTPHVANFDAARLPALAERVRENVARFTEGQELVARIDLDRGY